jgi:hypothetical protein
MSLTLRLISLGRYAHYQNQDKCPHASSIPPRRAKSYEEVIIILLKVIKMLLRVIRYGIVNHHVEPEQSQRTDRRERSYS